MKDEGSCQHMDNDTPSNRDRLLAELKQAQSERSRRQKALYDVADAAQNGMADRVDAVRVIHKADKQRFASAISDLMKTR